MGDMKTPDFDDLLAAFDIPDIDAKEAIQSSPEEERDQLGTNVGRRRSGSPPCFPPAAPHSEPPVVSVIVKNTVRSESVEEEDKSVRDKADNPASSAVVSRVGVKLDDLTTQITPKLSSAAGLEPQLSNGIEEPVTSHQQQSSTESWSRSLPLRPVLNDKQDESHTGAELGSSQHTTDVINSFRPLLYPESLTTARSTSPPPSPPLPVSSHTPHSSSPRKDEPHLQSNPSSSPLPQNKNTETNKLVHTDDDSEPDLEGPLVIQESPESSPPTFKRRDKSHSDIFVSPCTTSSPPPPTPPPPPPPPPKLTFSMAPANSKSSHQDDGRPASSKPLPSAGETHSSPERLPSVSTNSALVQKDEYPDRIIEERDSPESPPPYETGLIDTNRSSCSDSGQTPGQNVNCKEVDRQEEPMETSQEGHPDGIELSVKVSEDGENLNELNCDADSEDAASADVADAGSTAVHPIKVRIKVPRSNSSRTGTASKRGGRASSKSVDGPKRLPRSRNTKAKKELLQQSAVALLQDACAATLQGAIKEKTLAERKPKVSPTAVNITKNATLPSVSSSRGAVSLRNLGQKTLNSGITLPAPLPLLPPQTNSRPASIVNNTGAIISKSQTNLVEAFNKILNNKNLLPSYKPDLSVPLPAEWGIPLPAQGYRCLECGDAFALERSLAQHYDRRSLRIEVTCNHCTKRLAFFNKCSLLLHAREHKEKGLIMQCSHLVMKPVPVEQMISQQEPTAAGPSGQARPKPVGQGHQVAPIKKSEAAQYNNNKCPECQLQFSSKEEVAEHFQEIKAAQSSSCTECYPPMLLPNSCSTAAHQRVHQACAPHVCPECGGTFKQPVFQTHLSEDCLHFSRRIGYRCSSCLVVFGGLNSVKSHIQQAHCDLFHKCPSCPMAFKSAPSIQNHINAQHPNLTEKQTLLIYKCVMCDTVFTHKPLLHVHFDSHLVNQKVHVFKCPECSKLFSQRNSLLEHSKTHRTATLKPPSPPAASAAPSQSAVKSDSSGEESMNEESLEKEKSVKFAAPSGWTCQSCHSRFRAREDYVSHMREKHDQILKKYPCNKCASSFSNNSNMMRHIRDKHTVTSQSFRCQFCSEDKKTFSSRAMLERHVLLRHTAEAESHDTVQRVKEEAETSSEQDSSVGTCRKKPREAGKKKLDEDSTDKSSAKKLRSSAPSQSIAPFPPPDSGFRCAPCGFTTEEQAAFLEHIGQHRGTEGAALQCLQCGACFASSSSLSRHRFITHKVKGGMPDGQPHSPGSSRNHKAKSSVNGSAPTSPFSQAAASQGSEEEGALGCKVCGKHFEKVTDLNTHFRTHGMAFISARNAGKNP